MASISVLTSLKALGAWVFWGVELDDRRMHSVQWDRVLADNIEGGLGVGSLFSFNMAMLFHWHLHIF